MSKNWMEALINLQDYIAKTKEIEINSEAVCLPDSVRPEFYRRFDAVRNEFVKEKMSAHLVRAEELSQHYKEIKSRLCQILGIGDITVGTWLGWFLDDPSACLARILFDPLMDLVKTKLSIAEFEQHSSAVLAELFDNLFRIAYDRYCTLALIETVEPDEAFIVPVTDRTTDPALTDAELIPGGNIAILPRIEKANVLSLDHIPFSELLAPKVIVHSKLGCYIGFRPDYHVVYRREESAKDINRWSKTADIWAHFGKEDLWPDLGIYVSTNLEDLRMIGDYFNIIKPDLIVEFEESGDWYDRGHAASAIRHYQVSKPALGSFILCLEPISEKTMKRLKPAPELASANDQAEPAVAQAHDPLNLPDEIAVIQAGFDLGTLLPVIKAIESACPKA